MPRQPRWTTAGTLVHLIARFVNEEFLMRGEEERNEYLRRVAKALGLSDWVALFYALMSSHVHWVFVAGRDPIERFVKSLHGGFARWLNRSTQRIGHVWADRPRTLVVDDDVRRIAAYLHNNPVRAGVVTSAADSRWTSHQAYLGLAEAPPWLAVERGLELVGLDASKTGREDFDAVVNARRNDPRIPELSDPPPRRAIGRLVGPVQVAETKVKLGGDVVEVEHTLVRTGARLGILRCNALPADVVRGAAEACGVDESLVRQPLRHRALSHARRVALKVWVEVMGRPAVDMARELGIAASSASELLVKAPERDPAATKAVAAVVRWLTKPR